MTYPEWWFQLILDPFLDWLRSLGVELSLSLSNPAVWAAIGTALIFGAVALAFGVWFARTVRLLDEAASIGETVGVGLSLGLVVFAASWAAVASGARSTFTPIAVGFVVALVVGLLPTRRSDRDESPDPMHEAPIRPAVVARKWLGTLVVSAGFVVVVGLVYGSTVAPSPRDGVQPVEFNDEAFYSVLGANLAVTGLESVSYPSGFDAIPGIPTQGWYHWGELWLASAVIKIASIEPMFARYYVVLPLILLAVAGLTGTLVRRLSGTTSRVAFASGAGAGVVLAPMPLVLAGFFGWWSRSGLFGVTQYGLAVIIGLLALYAYATCDERSPWSWSILVGALVASLVASHVVLAVVAFVGISAVWIMRSATNARTARRILPIPVTWRRAVVCAALVGAVTALWAFITGHGFAAVGASARLPPFGGYWLVSVVSTVVGGGVFFAIPIAWWATGRRVTPTAWLYLAAGVTMLAGSLIWGARLADFDTFHFFFGAILVFGTPAAAIAIWELVGHLQTAGRRSLATIVVTALGLQMAIGGVAVIERLRAFGVSNVDGIPVAIVEAIRALPSDAKLAYSCRTPEEATFWNPGLISIEAHTGRRVVPMCFEADFNSSLNGAELDSNIESALFRWAPQRELYPRADAKPSAAEVSAFLSKYGIGYIYADASHPNLLGVPAVPVATSGASEVLRIR